MVEFRLITWRSSLLAGFRAAHAAVLTQVAPLTLDWMRLIFSLRPFRTFWQARTQSNGNKFFRILASLTPETCNRTVSTLKALGPIRGITHLTAAGERQRALSSVPKYRCALAS